LKYEEKPAAFETITGRYARSRGFNQVQNVKKFTEKIDGFYGYEVIFNK